VTLKQRKGKKMKLAEALLERADAQRRYTQMDERLKRFAKVQEGDKPAEQPRVLLSEMNGIAARVMELVQRINRTNNMTAFESGKSLADVLAERDALAMQRNTYAELAKAATVTQDRYLKSEMKFVSTVDIAVTQKEADDMARRYRELDAKIQALNWTTELAN
jgi:hypothetical protein